MKAAILALVVLICGVDSKFWEFASSTAPRDCQWMAWYSPRRCLRLGPPGTTVYGYRQFRYMIPSKFGGKNCTGFSEEILPCTELEYFATTLLLTVTAATPERPERSKGDGAANTTCVKSYRDSKGVLRMMGKPCLPGRPKREVEVLDTSEEIERNRVKRDAFSSKNRDVLFLIDENSNDRVKLPKFLRMAKALTNSFCGPISVARELTRVGVLTFDKEQHHQIDFDRYFQRADMIDHMDEDITQDNETDGATCLVDALSYTRDRMFVKRRGARVRNPNVDQMVVLMTDGCHNCRDQGDLSNTLIQIRETFQEQNIPVVTLYVGADNNCLTTLRGLADGSQCYQVFRAKDFEELDDISFAIERSECVDGWRFGPSCTA